MDAIEAIHGRRSIRSYRLEPLLRELIEEVIWDAVQAPTPPISGAAPWAFCAIEGAARIASLGARAKKYARDHQPERRHAAWPDDSHFKVFWDAPTLVLICRQTDNVESALDCCRPGLFR